MKTKIMRLIFLVIMQYLAIANPVLAITQVTFARKIDELCNINFASAMFGLVVQDAKSGKILYEKAAHTAFVPASATKLFVVAAALHKLTPQFRFVTKVKYYKTKVNNGVLNGAIALEFKGDPSFTSAHLIKLIRSIKQANITTIAGDLILDDTYFQGPVIGNGWSYDDTPWYYATPITAINIDGNQVNIAIKSGKQLGQLATANLVGKNKQYFKIGSAAIKMVTWQASESVCQLQAAMDNANNVTLAGCLPIQSSTTNLRLAVQNSRKLASNIITNTLVAEKIKLQGNIIYKKTPAGMTTLATHASLPLANLLPKILGNSNNTYAEALLKTLGAKLYHKGNFKTGVLAVKNILQLPTGINFDAMNLVDGSGLSRYTLVTPNQFARLLYTMYHSPALKGSYVQALALAGARGTLKARLGSFDTAANITAKTGSLRGVSSLAGYLKTRTNKMLIFTMLVNNSLLPMSTLKKIEDELCQVIVNYAE